MIFTAYFDESNTHGEAPDLIVAGFLGNVRQWAKFGKRLEKLQKRFGFIVLHYKDLKAARGEFLDWDETKRNNLIEEMIKMIRKLEQGVTVSVSRERYIAEYREGYQPSKMHKDSQLGLCFRGCLGFMIDNLDPFEDGLHVVFESGHNNVEDCRRIFEEVKKIEARANRHQLRTFTIAGKTECYPLMLGDILAATYLNMKRAGVKLSDLKSTDQKFQRGMLAFLELPAGSLENLKVRFEENKKNWRNRNKTSTA